MNKLGVSENRLLDIERKIVNFKLNLLDEYFTFNCEKLNFEYLKKLHIFLFEELYFHEDYGIRTISPSEEKMIDYYLEKINYICVNQKNTEEILNIIKEIWYLQPFRVGNTRTMIAYLKILNKAFLLNIDVNVNIEIISNPSMFDFKKCVNQKRLTKK